MQANEGHKLIDIGGYQRLARKMIYLTLTRPDISYAVEVVSQFTHTPITIHLEEAYRIIRYLMKSPSEELLYHRRHDLQVEAFTDAN